MSAAARDGINAEIEELKRGDVIKQEQVKQSVAHVESLYKQGQLTHIDAIRQEEAAELAGVASREAVLRRELVVLGTKKNSQAETMSVTGELTSSTRIGPGLLVAPTTRSPRPRSCGMPARRASTTTSRRVKRTSTRSTSKQPLFSRK